MREIRSMICVVCPTGCNLEVSLDENGMAGVSGNRCKRGAAYAAAECVNPVRTLTGTVGLIGGRCAVAPVKSNKPVPKALMLECIREINKRRFQAPLKVGDILITNILNTGADIISTGNMQ